MIGWLQRVRQRRRQQAVADLQTEVGLRLSRTVENHTWLENELKPWLEAQLSPTRHAFMRVQNQLNATLYVLDFVIDAYPEPERLFRLWDELKPTTIDRLTEPGGEESEEDRAVMMEAWIAIARRYTMIMEQAVARRISRNRSAGQGDPGG